MFTCACGYQRSVSDILPHTQSTLYLRQICYRGLKLITQARLANQWASGSFLIALSAHIPIPGFFFNVGAEDWTRNLMLVHQTLYWAISTASPSFYPLSVFICFISVQGIKPSVFHLLESYKKGIWEGWGDGLVNKVQVVRAGRLKLETPPPILTHTKRVW